MEVYIEYVVIDNLIINYLLLWLTNLTLKLKAKKRMCFLSSVLGTIASVLMPLIKLNTLSPIFQNAILLVFKIFVGLILVLIIAKYKNFLYYITAFFLFLTYTFVLGGMCFGIMYLLNLETTFSGLVLFGFEIPVGLFVLLGAMYLKILYFIVKTIRHKNAYHKFYFDVIIKNDNKKIAITGFMDSGNQINENCGGVVVINYKTLIKLYPNLNYQSLIMGSLKNTGLKNAEFVNVINSSGNSKMLTFTLDELEIIDDNNKVVNLKNQKIGLAKTNFNGKFDCLLSPDVMF